MTRFATAAVIIALAACGPPEPAGPYPFASAIDRVFRDMDEPDVPGASVAVIQDGEIVYSNGYGSAQLKH